MAAEKNGCEAVVDVLHAMFGMKSSARVLDGMSS